MEKKRILIVDDHEDNLELLRIVLDDEYAVLTCGSSDEAIKLVDQFKPDLLMLDVLMYPVNGIECLHAIRAKSEWSGLPAIALTALARDVEKKAMLAAGFQAIVTKPLLSPVSLVGAIEELLKSPSAHDAESQQGETSARVIASRRD
jgi:CheY-like chemotaxis protein